MYYKHIWRKGVGLEFFFFSFVSLYKLGRGGEGRAEILLFAS